MPAASSPTSASMGTSRPRPDLRRAWHPPCLHNSIAASTATTAQPAGWARELDTFARAFGGAFLFGVPLLYTQETWNIGTSLDAGQLLLFLGLTFAAVLALAHVSGFRDEAEGNHLGKDLEQAVEALAVGAIGSLVVLLALDRLGPEDPVDRWFRMIALQTVPLSFGAALGNAFLRDRGSRLGGEQSASDSPARALAVDVAATAFGAFFLSFNIAPTEEVQLLATHAGAAHLIALIALSLVVGYAIVFEAEFVGIARRRSQPGPFQTPVAETALSYCVALLVAGGTLLLLGRLDLSDPLRDIVAQIVVLGLPATIGGAAGRLAA